MNALRTGKIEIGKRLRVARESAKISKEDAAAAVSVQPLAVDAWEKGRTQPCLVQFRDLMACYGASPYRVLFGRSMFGFKKGEVAELREAMPRFSLGLQRRLELVIAVQVSSDLDETVM